MGRSFHRLWETSSPRPTGEVAATVTEAAAAAVGTTVEVAAEAAATEVAAAAMAAVV